MTTFLAIMNLSTIALVLLIIIGFYLQKKSTLVFICLSILICQVFFGYMLIGTIMTCYSKKTHPKVEIVKNSNVVFVTTIIDEKQTTFEFIDHKSYREINDTTCVFTLIRGYNMYNCPTSDIKLEYEIKKN